jgi:zinc transporter ZupT
MSKIYPLVLSFITFLATLAGGYTAAKNRSKFGYIAAFSAGVLIAVPLFQLLPTSLTLAAKTNVSAQNVLYVTGLGFIFLYMLERLLAVKKVRSGDTWKFERHSTGGFYGASELALHSFVDGFSIGVGFHFNFQIGMVIALAVIFHRHVKVRQFAKIITPHADVRRRNSCAWRYCLALHHLGRPLSSLFIALLCGRLSLSGRQ